MKFFQRNEFWVITAVVVGFLLSTIWEIFKNKLSVRNKKKAIEQELITNLGFIPQKIDTLEQLRKSLQGNRVLDSETLPFTTYLYDQYIGDVASKLTNAERSSLHVIYENMKFIDRFLNNAFKEFIKWKSSHESQFPFDDYINKCDDVIKVCNLTREMINEHRDGNPRDVLWDDKNTQQTG